MRVWLIRHGESETNRDGLWTGWLDIALSERGREDAEKAGELLSKTKFDKIYSSDLLRAKTTAEIAIPNCEYETDPALREINVGNISGKPWGVVMDEQNRPMNRDGYKIFGGESNDEFRTRVSGFMNKLEKMEYENVAIFSHGGWLRTALSIVLDAKLAGDRICCGNCTVAVFEYNGSLWKLSSWINLDRTERKNETSESR